MISATLSSEFQLAIPQAIREQLDLKAGQRFALITKGNVIEWVPLGSLSAARGSFKGCNPGDYRDRQDRINGCLRFIGQTQKSRPIYPAFLSNYLFRTHFVTLLNSSGFI